MDQGMYHNSGGESNSFPNLNGVCHRHRRSHSDPDEVPLGDMKAELVESHHEICRSLVRHFHKKSFRVGVGTLHNQGVGETVQGMAGLERWTFVQSTVVIGKCNVSFKSIGMKGVHRHRYSQGEGVSADELLVRLVIITDSRVRWSTFEGEDSMYESYCVSRLRVGNRACSRVSDFRVFPERDGALQKGVVQWGFARACLSSRESRERALTWCH